MFSRRVEIIADSFFTNSRKLLLLALSSVLLLTGLVTTASPTAHAAGSINGGLVSPTSGIVEQPFLGTSSLESWYSNYYDQNNAVQPRTQPEHSGIDISNSQTDCTQPVYAAAGGKVIWAGFDDSSTTQSFGWSVVVSNGFNVGGNGEYMFTLYGHMGTPGHTSRTSNSCVNVKAGQTVNSAASGSPTLLGYQGSSGLSASATHVHFTVFVGPQDYTRTLKSPYISNVLPNTYPASPDPYFCIGLTQGDATVAGSLTLGQNDCSSTWLKTFGGANNDNLNAVAQANDGGYVTAGTGYYGSKRSLKEDLWVTKLNKAGNILWSHTFQPGTSNWGYVKQILPTSDGGYLLTGSDDSGNDSLGRICPAAIIKLDANGNIAWQKTYGGSSNSSGGSCAYVVSIVPANDGGYIAAGVNFGINSNAGWIFKIDNSGNVVWDQLYAANGYESTINDIKPTANGYIVAGSTGPNNTPTQSSYGWVMMVDNVGTMILDDIYGSGSPPSAAFNNVIPTGDGGYYLGGKTANPNASGTTVPWVVKLDATGSRVWEGVYDNGGNPGAIGAMQLVDGNNFVAYVNNNSAVSLMKFNSDGAILWQKAVSNFSQAGAHSLIYTNDGAYLLVGSTATQTNSDAEVLKVGADGSVGQNSGCNGITNDSFTYANIDSVFANFAATQVNATSLVGTSSSVSGSVTPSTATVCGQ